MKRLLSVAALALLLAPAAAAKEITGAEICGADGCRAVAVPSGVHDFPGGHWTELAAAPPLGTFVEVRLEYDGGQHRESLWYIPEERLFARPDGHGSALFTTPREQPLDQALVRAAAAFAPQRPYVISAHVDGVRIAGGLGYGTLFSIESPGPLPEYSRTVDVVSVRTEPHSPWAAVRLWFHPESGLLQRGVEVVDLPPSVAADLRARRAIRAAAGTDGNFAWPLVTGSLLAAMSLGLVTLLVSRRTRHIPAQP